jgi:uncharacterized protein YbjT (DUF2867 family)
VAKANSNRTILVTGATGKQGGAVLHKIRERGFPVRAMTRDPQKPAARALLGQGVEVVAGDFNNPESLRRAMDEVYGVFSMSTPYEQGAGAEVAQGKALADAAQTARVTHYVYTSVGSADQKTGIPHFDSKYEVELHVQRLGFPYLTILRPVFFMENWLGMKDQIEGGTLRSPLSPDTKLQQIAVADIAAFAALAFEHPDTWYRKAVDLAGDELSGTEQAGAFSTKLARPVEYQQVPWDQFEQKAGPELTTMYRWFEETGYHADINALREKHSGLRTFDRWLNENWR